MTSRGFTGRKTNFLPFLTGLRYLLMNQEEKRKRIQQEIEDTFYAYHLYPHMALVPDWFLRYWDLAEAIADYFDVPFDKPKLAPQLSPTEKSLK